MHKFTFLILFFIFPVFVFSQIINISWQSPATSNQLSNGEYSITGSFSLSGVSQSSDLIVLLFMANNIDFNPIMSFQNMGPADNAIYPFNISSNSSSGIFLLPVVVDSQSLSSLSNNSFLPYDNMQSQFNTLIIGQAASVSTQSNNQNQQSGGGGGGQQGGGGGGQQGGSSSGGTDTSSGSSTGDIMPWPTNSLSNPLQVSSINSFVSGLLNALLKIGIPIMVVFLVYSGLKLVMARGNEKELEEAKKNLSWVIIGVAVLLSSWTIVRILKGTLDQIDISYIYQIINNYFV